MANLRATTGHIWDTRDELGKGATSNVYLGRDKKTGKKCAIKMFTVRSMMNPELRKREMDVLRKLKHPSIVDVYAIEQETTTRFDVVVMELCCGSLLDVLRMPENSFGMAETEMLRFMPDLAAGMEYLKSKAITHRDIKPGNIMRCTAPDGSYVYKLADFGTARELGDNETFISLHGTEEYLHPDMYARAFMNERQKKVFNNKVDLWSIGVTLYHAATGQLPFQPYRGREEKNVMYRLTTRKESGVIAGVEDERGNIHWSSSLPETCELSTGLQELLAPMIAGLEECDLDRMWDFDKFFREVKTMTSMVVVDVVDLTNWQLLHLYLPKTARLSELKPMISKQTGQNLGAAFLMQKGAPVNVSADCPVTVGSLPPTAPTDPIILWGTPASKELSVMNIPGYLQCRPATPFHSLLHDMDLSLDINAVSCAIKRIVTAYGTQMMVADTAAILLGRALQTQTQELQSRLGSQQRLLESAAKRVDDIRGCLELFSQYIVSRSTPLPEDLDSRLKALRARLDRLEDAKKKLVASLLPKMAALKKETTLVWDSDWLHSCRQQYNWVGQARVLEAEIAELYDSFKAKQHKTQGGRARFGRNDQNVHEFERISLHGLSRSVQDTMKECLDKGVGPVLKRLHQFQSQVTKVRADIDKQEAMYDTCHEQVTQLHTETDGLWKVGLVTLTDILQAITAIEEDIVFVKKETEDAETKEKTQELARIMLTRLSGVLREMSAMKEQVNQSNVAMRTKMDQTSVYRMPKARQGSPNDGDMPLDSLMMSMHPSVYLEREKARQQDDTQ